MSTMGTIPIPGPDGQVHSVPQDQASSALAAGGKTVAKVQDPTGTARWVPSDQVGAAQQNKGTVLDAAPSDEELQFLQQNQNHQWQPSNPRYPNRPSGIYPTGPGNEWRNDPSYTQSPVDLHFAAHTAEAAAISAVTVGGGTAGAAAHASARR